MSSDGIHFLTSWQESRGNRDVDLNKEVIKPAFDFAKKVITDVGPTLVPIALGVAARKGLPLLRFINKFKPPRSLPEILQDKWYPQWVQSLTKSAAKKPGAVVSRQLIDRAKTETLSKETLDAICKNASIRKTLVEAVKTELPIAPRSKTQTRKMVSAVYRQMGGPRWLGTLKQQLHQIQKTRQLWKESQSVHRMAAKKFLRAYDLFLTLGLVGATATVSYLSEKDKAKRIDVDQSINEHVQEIQKAGKALESLLTDQLSTNTQQQEELISNIMAMISKLPKEEQKQYLQALEELKTTLSSTRGEAEETIRTVLSKFSQIPLSPTSSTEVATMKNMASHLATAVASVGIASVFSKVSLLKAGMQRLAQLGVSKKVIDKFLIGIVSMGTAQAIKTHTEQTVKKQDVEAKTKEVLTELGIDASQESTLSPEEKQLSEGLTTASLGILGKIATTLVDIENPAFAELAETIFISAFKVTMDEHIEQSLTGPEVDAAVEKGLTGTQDEMKKLHQHIFEIGSHGEVELKSLQEVVQERLDSIVKERLDSIQKEKQVNVGYMQRAFNWLHGQ